MDQPSRTPTLRRRLGVGAALASFGIIAGSAIAAVAQTASAWSQAQGGPTHAGYAAEAPAPPYREAWHLDIAPGGTSSSFGTSSPVIDRTTVFTVAPDEVVAADLTSGDQLWTVDRAFGPPVSPAIASAGGSRLLLYTEGFGDSPPGTSPTPSADAGSPATPAPATGPFDSRLTAIDIATREQAWPAPLQLKEVSRTGVTVDGDTAYLGDNRGNVYAVDAATGELRWTVALGGFLTVPLAVADGQVIATVQASRTVRPRVIALKASDGSQIWSTDVEASAAFVTAPAIDDDQVIAGFSDQTVRAFDLSGGAERWSARMNAPVFFTGAPALAPDAVVAVDSMGQVYRLDRTTGARVWDFALNRAVLRAAPVVARGTVLVATADGRLEAIDLTSGRLVWQGQPSGSVLRSLTLTPDTVVAVRGGTDGGLVAFTTDPGGSLVSVVSPTVPNLPLMFGAFLAAAIPLGALLILGGRALRSRMGPAFLDDEDGPDDPWGSSAPDDEVDT